MKPSWTNVTRKLSELDPWERNPRQINEAQAERLKESFEEFGQIETIAIGPGNEIYNGHQRLNVLMEEYGGDYAVECRQSDKELSEKEREMLTIFLHKGTTGDWDWDILANEFEMEDLIDWGFEEGELIGFEEDPPEDPGPKIDEADKLREKWGVEDGQLWQLGNHRVICGDCTDKKVVDQLMNGLKVSLIVSDPPYGVDYEGGAGNIKKREKILGDETAGLYYPFLQNAPMNDKIAVYLWLAGREAEEVYKAVRLSGLKVRALIIWHKLNAHYGAFMAQYKQKHEPCLYAVRSAPKFSGPTNEVTVWEHDQPSRNEYHPIEKPLALFERPISNHPYKEVYDGFLGSGTTLIACERLARICYGIEIEPKYVAVTLERWHEMTGEDPVKVDILDS